jgi:hypothetical protein
LEGKGGGVTLGKQKTKDMSKTIKEWFNELPEGYRERAIKNTQESRMNNIWPTMSEAIYGAFNWSLAPERFNFWICVHDHYEKGTPLPPMPNSYGSKHEQAVSPVPTFTKEDLWETWWASAIKTVSFDGPDKEYERTCFDKFYEWKLANTKTP